MTSRLTVGAMAEEVVQVGELLGRESLLVRLPRVLVGSLEVGQRHANRRRKRWRRRRMLRHALDQDRRDEGRNFVGERLDEGGDAEDRRVWVERRERGDESSGKPRHTSSDKGILVACDLVALDVAPLRDLRLAQSGHEAADKRDDGAPLRAADDAGQGGSGCLANLDLRVAEEVAELVHELGDDAVAQEEEVVVVEDCAARFSRELRKRERRKTRLAKGEGHRGGRASSASLAAAR